MKLSDLRTFTPIHWAMMIVVAFCLVVAAIQVLGGLGFRFDPFNSAERRADRAEASAGHARSDAAARRIETSGQADTTRLVEAAASEAAALNQIAASAETSARTAADASLPLDPDRAQRLRDADRRLCAHRRADPACDAASP